MSVHESPLPPPVRGAGRVGPGVLWSFIGLAFLAVMLDGFDTVSLAFSLPSLSAQWNVPPAEFSIALVMTNLGAVTGYILSGRLAVAFGPKRLLYLGVAWYGMLTLLVAATLPLAVDHPAGRPAVRHRARSRSGAAGGHHSLRLARAQPSARAGRRPGHARLSGGRDRQVASSVAR